MINFFASFVLLLAFGTITKLVISIFTRSDHLTKVSLVSVAIWLTILIGADHQEIGIIVPVISGLLVVFIFHSIDQKISTKFAHVKNIVKDDTLTTVKGEISDNRSSFKKLLPPFIKEYFDKSKAKQLYAQSIILFLQDNQLDESEKLQLQKIVRDNNLTEKDITEINKRSFINSFSTLAKTGRITENDQKNIGKLEEYFKLSLKDYPDLQRDFNQLRVLDMIDHRQLPDMKDDFGLNINFDYDEKLHWATQAALMKHKKVTQRYQYKGFSGSVRIMKGLRYRAGSYRVASQSKDFLVSEDIGILWITNQRLGFKGKQKDIEIKYKSILSSEVTGDGLVIAKRGKEIPYIIKLNNYEIPSKMIKLLTIGVDR